MATTLRLGKGQIVLQFFKVTLRKIAIKEDIKGSRETTREDIKELERKIEEVRK